MTNFNYILAAIVPIKFTSQDLQSSSTIFTCIQTIIALPYVNTNGILTVTVLQSIDNEASLLIKVSIKCF